MLAKIQPATQIEDQENRSSLLWASLRNGDENALADLFRNFYFRLYNYGYKIVPNEDFIKDAIQKLFLRLWEKRLSISEAESVKAYLFSSFRRIIFRKLKKRENQTKRNHDYEKNSFNEVYNIEELMIHFETDCERKEQLALAMKMLSKRQTEAIYLKFYEGLSNSEIAEVMKINVQSVYNHVSESIQAMQAFVGE